MEYRCAATSVTGFVQQLVSCYLPHGYWFYVSGIIPPGKKPESIDHKLIERYGIGVSTYYIECSRCGDLLHSVPRQTVECSCKGIRIDLETQQVFLETSVCLRWVRLIGRGT